MSHDNALQPVAPVPQHLLQKYLREDSGYRDDIGALGPRDIRAPFIKVVSGMSKEGKPGWGPTGAEAPMPYGTIILSHNRKVLPQGSSIVPLVRRVVYIKWKDGEPGTRMEGFATREDDPAIVAERGLDFLPDPKNPKENRKPTWDTYINFYVLTEASLDQPVILSFYRTSLKAGRSFTQELFQATRGLKLPLFMFKYKLGIREVEQNGRKWPTLTLTSEGLVKEEALPICEKMYQQAGFLAAASNSAEFISELAGANDTGDHSATPVQGQVIVDAPIPPQPAPMEPKAPAFQPPAANHVAVQSPQQATHTPAPAAQPTTTTQPAGLF